MTEELDTTEDAELDATEAADLERLCAVVRQGRAGYIQTGQALCEINTRDLYRVCPETGRKRSFGTFCEAEFGMKKAYAYQLIEAYKTVTEFRMSAIADILLPVRETQVRPLLRLRDPEDQKAAWLSALAKHADDPKRVEEKDVREEAAKFLPEKAEPDFEFAREREVIFKWLLGRLDNWPARHRDTFADFVSKIARNIQEQQRAH